jgi:hypothetical protein
MLDCAVLAFSELPALRVFVGVKSREPDINWFAEPARVMVRLLALFCGKSRAGDVNRFAVRS